MHPAAKDLLVVETASVLAGPLVGQFFAELGARVVKVENPATGGDVTRQWKTVAEAQDETCPAYFSAVNWGKDSVALDLKAKQGKTVLLDLLSKADVWVDNFPAAVLERLGLDPELLLTRFPRLIHARINAYGDHDPRPGYDAALQAETGLMSMNGTAASGPLKLPLAMVDILAAHQLKEAVLLALWQRERTGAGGAAGVSLYDSGVTALANQASNYLVAGQVASRMGSGHPNIVPYGTVFDCADGRPVVLAVGTDGQFARLCEILGDPGLSADKEFALNQDRVRNRERLNGRLAALIARTGREFLLAELARRKVPGAAVLGIDEVMTADATAPLLLHDAASGRTGLRTVAFGTGAPAAGLPPLKRPPRLNEDAADVFATILGYAPGRIGELCGETGAPGAANT